MTFTVELTKLKKKTLNKVIDYAEEFKEILYLVFNFESVYINIRVI